MKYIVALLVAGVFFIAGIVTYANTVAFGAEQEQLIQTTHRNNVQILGQYTATISEAAQIPAMQRDNLKEVLKAAFEGRYGPDGSQAVFQFIRESYPGTIDNTLYQNLQTMIASGRTDFRDNQTKLLDQKRIYQTNLNYFFKGTLLKIAGYPKINLADYDVVTSDAASVAFSTGIDNGLTIHKPAEK